MPINICKPYKGDIEIMFKLLLSTLILVLGSVSVSFSSDDSIKVIPGNYSITTTTRSNIKPNPEIRTEDQCIEETSYNPSKFMSEDDGCTASNIKKEGNNINLSCRKK